jgi:hypothetical protein
MNLRPMRSFDPHRFCTVHDAVHNRLLTWQPVWAPHFLECADDLPDGVVEWDGLLLDGWSELAVVRYLRP